MAQKALAVAKEKYRKTNHQAMRDEKSKAQLAMVRAKDGKKQLELN